MEPSLARFPEQRAICHLSLQVPLPGCLIFSWAHLTGVVLSPSESLVLYISISLPVLPSHHPTICSYRCYNKTKRFGNSHFCSLASLQGSCPTKGWRKQLHTLAVGFELQVTKQATHGRAPSVWPSLRVCPESSPTPETETFCSTCGLP